MHCDQGALYRTLSVSLTQLMNENERNLDLFTDEFQRLRQEKLAKTIDALQTKYGKGVVSKAISLTEAGTKYGRLGLMAGHQM